MRKLLFSLAVIVAMVVGLAGPAVSARPETATGSFTLLSESYTFLGTVGSDTYFDGVLTLAYEGGLTGFASDGETFVVHSDGTFEGRGIEVCTACTIGGRTGDFVAAFDVAGGPSFTDFSGTLTFLCGAGGLAGLRGGGHFVGTAAGNTYSYRYRFEKRNRGDGCSHHTNDDD